MKLNKLKLMLILRLSGFNIIKRHQYKLGIFGSTRLMRCLLCSLLLFPIISQSASQVKAPEQEEPRWFEIEIILYKSNSDKGLFDESWTKNTSIELPDNIIDFLQPYAMPENNELPSEQTETQDTPNIINEMQNNHFVNQKEVPFTLLDEAFLQLTKESKNIANNSRYQLLTHFSWRQPVLDKNASIPIRIAGGEDFQALFEYSGEKKLVVPELNINDINTDLQLEETDLSLSELPLSEQLSEQQSSGQKLISEPLTNAPQQPLLSTFEAQSDTDNTTLIATDITTSSPPVPIALPWVPEIDGSILVYIQRNYLHLDTNLYFRRPDKEEVDIFSLNSLPSSLLNNSDSSKNNNNPALKKTGTSQYEVQSENDPTLQNNTVLQNNDPYGLNNDNLSWQYNGDFLNQKIEKVYTERLFNYSLKQNRRLRSKELHYFDHPLIGMLVMIRPYKFEESLSELNDLEE